MKVILKRRWGAYLPGQEIGVSEARAEYLVDELKIAKYRPGDEPKPEPKKKGKGKERDKD